jgi:hypothetical protein
MEARFRKHFVVNNETGCWVWTGAIRPDGYGSFWVGGSKSPVRLAHRIAWKLWRGELDGCVLHAPIVCHNRRCVNPDHLRIGTMADNNRDRILDGTDNAGSRHPASKLTEEQAQFIRSSTKTGIDLAREFNVSEGTISMIRSGKRRTPR